MSIVLFEEKRESTSWQIPPFEASPEERFGAIEDQIREGEGYLAGMKAYKNLGQNMNLFDAVFNDRSTSTLVSNFLKYNIRKFVETLSDIREIALYGSDAKQYKAYAEIENKVAKAIYTESQYPRALRKALQYATVMGVGYLWPKCKAQDYGFGERRIIFEDLGLLDVLPVQVPKSGDVQDAYLVTIYEYMPIAEAHALFPLFQSQLKPVDQISQPTRLAAKRLDFAERFKYGQENRNWGNLYCEIRYTFVRDMRINNTGFEMPMGDPNTTWFYKVPYIGQDIPDQVRNGQLVYKKAKAVDCRVYPQLRLLISTPGIPQPMYDGPGFDWHGKLPPVQFIVDDWPWETGGGSLIDAVGTIERTKRKQERQIDQVLTTKKDPPMGYDRGQTGGPKIENFDIFARNVRLGVDGEPSKILQSILPEEIRVEETDKWFVEYLKQMEEQQLGINDLGNLINMKINMSSDSFDKALESVGPIAKGIAANMEASNAKVAYMLKFMICQWMDAGRIIEYVGPDNVSPEIFDFDPSSLVPSHLADEYLPGGVLPFEEIEGVKVARASAYDKLTRAKVFARNLRLISIPSTLLKITAMQEQIKVQAAYTRGFPLPPDYVADKLGFSNWGTIPGDTLMEKWQNWEQIKLMLAAKAQMLAQKLGLNTAPQQTGKQHGGGRPPSDQKPGRQEMKDKNSGAPRPITRTS
jgi:hypothetical protein